MPSWEVKQHVPDGANLELLQLLRRDRAHTGQGRHRRVQPGILHGTRAGALPPARSTARPGDAGDDAVAGQRPPELRHSAVGPAPVRARRSPMLRTLALPAAEHSRSWVGRDRRRRRLTCGGTCRRCDGHSRRGYSRHRDRRASTVSCGGRRRRSGYRRPHASPERRRRRRPRGRQTSPLPPGDWVGVCGATSHPETSPHARRRRRVRRHRRERIPPAPDAPVPVGAIASLQYLEVAQCTVEPALPRDDVEGVIVRQTIDERAAIARWPSPARASAASRQRRRKPSSPPTTDGRSSRAYAPLRVSFAIDGGCRSADPSVRILPAHGFATADLASSNRSPPKWGSPAVALAPLRASRDARSPTHDEERHPGWTHQPALQTPGDGEGSVDADPPPPSSLC